ncbi:hypothetical protein D3C81_565180 [compost metagenome]
MSKAGRHLPQSAEALCLSQRGFSGAQRLMHLFELASATAHQMADPQVVSAEQQHPPEDATEQQQVLLCPKGHLLPE